MFVMVKVILVLVADEVAVNLTYAIFTSGGGFSNFTSQPNYQKKAVSAYMSSGVKLPPMGYYNPGMRAVPDVSALGTHGFTVLSAAASNDGGGTSMSTPIFSAVMSVLNSHQISQTGKPLGFLNPLLYKMSASQPNTFQDITSGDNICPEDGCETTCYGWLATKGWDPVTGLGTPNFANMLSYITASNQAKANKAKIASQ